MKITQFICLFSLLLVALSMTIRTEVSIINLKGMTSSLDNPDVGVKQEYANLSPAVGALFWLSPFLKNIYNYGPEKDLYTKFVQELFHVHVDGSFDTTRSAFKIAYYSDPEFIGHLVGLIFQAEKESADSFDSAAFAEKITKTLVEPMDKSKQAIIRQAIAENYTKAITRFESEIKHLMEKLTEEKNEIARTDNTKQVARRKAAIETYTGMLKKIKNPNAPIKDQMFITSKTGLGSLIATLVGQELDGTYPRGLTINTLLALLWKKSTNTTDLKHYLDAVAETTVISGPSSIFVAG